MNKFLCHPSIIKLKEKVPSERKFAFKPVTEEFVKHR